MVSRRLFLAGGISLGGVASTRKNEAVYHFATVDCDVRMSIVFYDHHSSSGFWFRDLLAGRRFCLSAIGEEGHNCLANFTGAIAVVRYRFRPHAGRPGMASLRERVRTIDQDTRLNDRPPFDRVIEVLDGRASDIQAFGYETAPSLSSPRARLPETGGPWYYFRQDLYFAERAAPFLVVHWRHALGAIRLLDVIPGDGTSPVKRSSL